jgi:adenosylcobinamide-GDP ribazoletransferase
MTRLPLGRFASHGESDLQASAAYFPVVGIVVGGVGAAVYAAASSVWPTSISIFLSTIATVYVTGAFHEDALADTLDGFGGGRSRERVLEIMKDSRVGSYALVGLTLILATKIAALFSIAAASESTGVTRSLIAGHVLARWSSIPLMMTCSYVRPASTNARPSAGGPFAGRLGVVRGLIATVFAGVAVLAALGTLEALVTAVVATLVSIFAGRWFKRRIGGITGDTLGAANQVVELAVYLVILARQ